MRRKRQLVRRRGRRLMAIPARFKWVRDGAPAWYASVSGGTKYAGVICGEPWQLGGHTWVVNLREMSPEYQQEVCAILPKAPSRFQLGGAFLFSRNDVPRRSNWLGRMPHIRISNNCNFRGMQLQSLMLCRSCLLICEQQARFWRAHFNVNGMIWRSLVQPAEWRTYGIHAHGGRYTHGTIFVSSGERPRALHEIGDAHPRRLFEGAIDDIPRPPALPRFQRRYGRPGPGCKADRRTAEDYHATSSRRYSRPCTTAPGRSTSLQVQNS